ncbi:MAG: SBBP repeat-containing protein, partial [Candidatus Nitrosocaldus sp.]
MKVIIDKNKRRELMITTRLKIGPLTVVLLAITGIALLTAISIVWAGTGQDGNIKRLEVMESFGRLPLYFIENKGQVDERVRFYEKAGDHSVYFTEEGVYMALYKKEDKGQNTLRIGFGVRTDFISLRPFNANRSLEIIAEERLEGKVNYLIGANPKDWRTDIPIYRKVRYKGLYPGIDLVFYGNQRQLEYDVVVKPGADLSNLSFEIRGANRVSKTEGGDIEIFLPSGGLVIHKKPLVYQEVGGEKREIDGSFRVEKRGDVYAFMFEVKDYDRGSPLIIDPLVLSYSTYLGGGDDDSGYGIAVDSNGNAYVTGFTYSADFPLKNAYQGSRKGLGDAFVTKIDTTQSGANSLVYSTYLGGGDDDYGYGIAVDSNGNAYVTGGTYSTDFPIKNAYQGSNAGEYEAFVTKLSSGGNSLIYSTYLGGSSYDYSYGIAVDSNGNAYVTGLTNSTDFPIKNAYQGYYSDSGDTFVTKIDTTQSGANSLVYSTYLGGGNYDEGYGIAVDLNGNAYVTGYTNSANFPIKNAYQGYYSGWGDAFVTKIDTTQSGANSLIYSTYLGGGKGDSGLGIAVDSNGNAYVTGETRSTNFPTRNAYDNTCGTDGNCNYDGTYSYSDAFVTKIDTTQSGTNSLIYSTYLGGGKSDSGLGIAVDSNGNAYVTGETWSTNFPTQ